MVLRQPANKQVELVDGAVTLLQIGSDRGVRSHVIERRVWFETERNTRLIQCAQTDIAFALNVDGDQVDGVRWGVQQVAQTINGIDIESLGSVVSKTA